MNQDQEQQPAILVTGVTGYVGGRLTTRLVEQGARVRVMVRGSTDRVSSRPWRDDVQVVIGDVFEQASLEKALANVDVAYYLIHSMSDHEEFGERDLQAARNFSRAAADAGVKRIIYLGGIGDPNAALSRHLESRHQTGAALREHGVEVTEFRASMIVGSGSLSFEMLRHLTERLPVMIAPRWVFTRTQPIAIGDVLNYLVAALETPQSAGQIIEIGGADVFEVAELMMTYARIRGLRRRIVAVPLLTPNLSSYWVHWTTPIPANIARPLINGLRNELVVRDQRAQSLFPDLRPIGYEAAVRLALARITKGDVETLWSDALASSQGDIPPVYLTQEQGMLIERREVVVDATPHDTFLAFTRLGGARGWPPYNWLWRVRGILDRLVGGVGLRRGRRHPQELRIGEALDFWRVEALEADQLLRLRAEMKLPGDGWLQFEAERRSPGQTALIQTALFAPKGLLGLLYWYAVYPLHGPVFSRMIAYVAQEAEAGSSTATESQL